MMVTLHLAHHTTLESPQLQKFCLGAILRPLKSSADQAPAL